MTVIHLSRAFGARSLLAPTALIAGLAVACSSATADTEISSPPDASVDGTASDAGQEADSHATDSPAETSPQEGSVPVAEVCNFLDDDGDGEVDEGFAWKAGEWKHLLSTQRFAVAAKPVPLGNDRIAIAGWDQFGDPGDKAFVGIWKSDGTLVAGPVWIDVPQPFCGRDEPTLSLLGEDRLLLLFASTDWAGCKNGCPEIATELSRADLSVVKSVPWVLPSFVGSEQQRLVCPSAEQCLLAASGAGLPIPRILSIDPASAAVGWTHELDSTTVSFDVDDGRIFVLTQPPEVDAGPPSSVLQVLGLDGEPIGEPRVVGQSPEVRTLGVRHLHGSTYVEVVEGTPAKPYLVRIPDDGSPPVVAPSSHGGVAFALEQLGDDLVMASEGATGFRVHRLAPDLTFRDVPLQSVVIPKAYSGTSGSMLWTGSRLAFVQATYDGRSVEMTTMECAP